MTENDAIDQQLRRLSVAVRSVGPTPGFVERVMASIGTHEPAWWQLVSGPARWILPAAALGVLVSTLWAYEARSVLDDSLAVGLGAESYSIEVMP